MIIVIVGFIFLIPPLVVLTKCVLLEVCDMKMCESAVPTKQLLTVNYTNYSYFNHDLHSDSKAFIWRHSIGYSISTSPAPIIYFGLFS